MRVRFAPSPTGRLHLGSLKTALYNYLAARSSKGAFILRIEDTDPQREVPGCAEEFEKTLDAFGLARDEGPRQGGAFGPYVQSLRTQLYNDRAERLIDSGHAYRCFCSPETLDALRREAQQRKTGFKYNGQCRHLSKEEARAKQSGGEPSAVRFKFDPATIHFEDTAFGRNTQHLDEGDFVLVKSSGQPTYHFACVVDDKAMAITNVIRGEEWLSSTPKHVKLYEAFEWKQPVWTHLPVLRRGVDDANKKKLSKRDADAEVDYYLKQEGYLPLAILNYLIRSGNGIRDFEKDRFYSLEEMVDSFDLRLVTNKQSKIDPSRLETYGRLAFQSADLDSLLVPAIQDRCVEPQPPAAEYIRRVVDFLRRNEESTSRLSQITDGQFRFFFSRVNSADKILQRYERRPASEVLQALLGRYPEGWSNEGLKEMAGNDEAVLALVQTATATHSKEGKSRKQEALPYKELTALLRLALIDDSTGPPISELLEFFSRDEITSRLENVIGMLKAN